MNSTGKNKFSKNLIYTASFILITILSLIYKLFLSGSFDGFLSSGSKADVIAIETAHESCETHTSETSTQETEPQIISVYICGEVMVPGVYELEAGSIVNDAVLLAGGFTENAAAEKINLVYIINSNISIYIPGEDEVYEDSEVIRDEGEYIWGGSQTPENADSVSNKVNINTATRDELMTLSGVGEATADSIIEYRTSTPFSTIEEIMNVSGIGEAKFNKIRDFICV